MAPSPDERMQGLRENIQRWHEQRRSADPDVMLRTFQRMAEGMQGIGIPAGEIMDGMDDDEASFYSDGDTEAFREAWDMKVLERQNWVAQRVMEISMSSPDGRILDPALLKEANLLAQQAMAAWGDGSAVMRSIKNMMRPWLSEWQDVQNSLKPVKGPLDDAPIQSAIKGFQNPVERKNEAVKMRKPTPEPEEPTDG